MRTPAVTWTLIAAALVLVTLAGATTGEGAGSPARHAYLLPIIAAALRFGLGAAIFVSISALLLHAPFVLSEIERAGFTARAADGAAFFATCVFVGLLIGAASDRSRLVRRLYETTLVLQRAMADGVPTGEIIERVRRILLTRLGMDEIGLLVLAGEHRDSAGFVATADVDDVLRTGTPRFVPDARRLARPCRRLVAPLVARGETVGVLCAERVGDIGATEQAALVTLAGHLGLAFENARLTSRQRRFADELEEKVAAATRRLQEMDRAKSTFVATASHELRTPLTALLGFGELMTTRTFGPDETRRLAGIMHRETERLVRIVDDLLDLSRLERGLSPTLHRAAVDVTPALVPAVEMFRRQQVAHHFEIECEDEALSIDADPDAFDRIVKNLISNAVKYSPPGLIVVRARRVDTAVEFQVEDRGRGIPAESLPKLFDAYYRVPDNAGAARGTGLGLAIVKSLIEAHSGEIRVESVLGAGTRVTFTLPATPSSASAGRACRPDRIAGDRGRSR